MTIEQREEMIQEWLRYWAHLPYPEESLANLGEATREVCGIRSPEQLRNYPATEFAIVDAFVNGVPEEKSEL